MKYIGFGCANKGLNVFLYNSYLRIRIKSMKPYFYHYNPERMESAIESTTVNKYFIGIAIL